MNLLINLNFHLQLRDIEFLNLKPAAQTFNLQI